MKSIFSQAFGELSANKIRRMTTTREVSCMILLFFSLYMNLCTFSLHTKNTEHNKSNIIYFKLDEA